MVFPLIPEAASDVFVAEGQESNRLENLYDEPGAVKALYRVITTPVVGNPDKPERIIECEIPSSHSETMNTSILPKCQEVFLL